MSYVERGENWGVGETHLLLKIWGRPWFQREMLTTIRNLDIYNQIAKEMQHLMPHISRTGLQCRYRIKRLKREFLRAKNEGCLHSFHFYEEMERVLTQRAKAVNQVGESSGGKKRIRKRRSKYSDDEDEDFGTPTNEFEIKIEIDNAEEYEYGVSRRDNKEEDNTIMTRSKSLNLGSKEKDSSDDDSEEGSEYNITSSFFSNTDTSKIDEMEYVSFPDNEVALTPTHFGFGDRGDLNNDDGNLYATGGDACSSSIDNSLRSESSDSSVPLPLVIKSVYHVKETDHGDATDAEKRDPYSNPSRDRINSLDEMKGEGALRYAPGHEQSDTVTESHVLDGLPIVTSQATKDLQIIAEWSVEGEAMLDAETGQSCGTGSDSDSGPDLDSEPGSPALHVSAVTTSSASFEGGTCKEKGLPKVSLPGTASSSAQLPSSPGTRYKIVEAGGVHTLVKLKEDEPVFVSQPGDCEVSTASSKHSSLLRTLKPKPSVTLLSPLGSKPRPKPGVSLLPSPLKMPSSATAKVIRFEKPSVQKEASSSAPPGVRKVVVVSAPEEEGQSDTGSPLLQRHKVVFVSAPTASPTAAAPLRVVKGSPSSSIPVSSNQAGGEVFHGKTSASVAGTSIRQVTPDAHTVPLTTTSASKSLTFTTLSSLDPNPKTMTVSPDTSRQSQSSPGAVVPSFIIPRIISSTMPSPSAAANSTKVRNQESSEEAAEEMSEKTPTSATSEKLKGIKRSHEASENISSAKTVEVPDVRWQPDISSAQMTEGDSSVYTNEPLQKVLCRYPTASLSATHSAFPGKRKAVGLPPLSYKLLPTRPVPGLTSEGVLVKDTTGQLTMARKIFQTVAASSDMVSDRYLLTGKQHHDVITSSSTPERGSQYCASEGKILFLDLEGKQKSSFSTPPEVSTEKDEDGSRLAARILSQDCLYSVTRITNPVVVTRAPSLNRVTLMENFSRTGIPFATTLVNSHITDTEYSSAQCSLAHALDNGSSVLQAINTQHSSDHPSPWAVKFIGTTDSPPPLGTDTADSPPLGADTASSPPPMGNDTADSPPLGTDTADSPPLGTDTADGPPPPGTDTADSPPPLGTDTADSPPPLGTDTADNPPPLGTDTADSPSPLGTDTAVVADSLPSQSQAVEQEVLDTTDSSALLDVEGFDQTEGAQITGGGDQSTGSTSMELMNVQQSSETDLSDPADESDSDSAPNSQPEADSLSDASSHPVGTVSPQPEDKDRSSRLKDVLGDWSSLAEEEKDDLFQQLLSQTGLSGQQKEQMIRLFLSGRTDTTETTGHKVEPPPVAGDAANVEVTNLLSLGVNNDSAKTDKQTGTFKVKAGLAQMAKGGIIMDVTTPEEARIAEEAGACAVMALERVPADIRRQGGVARMTDPKKIKDIMAAVTIPVMAKCRIGHFAEAQILESLGVDMVDESEVLTPADEDHHVDKHAFKVPFVCGARDLGEALRRISEGAAMIRTKGDAGTGDVVEAVRHARTINRQIRTAGALDHTELYGYAKELRVPYDLLKKTAKLGRLPVVNFAAGGLATPADVSLLMQLGVDGVFVGSGIFKSSDPPSRAHAMAQAVTHYKDPKILGSLSENLGEAMFGTPVNQKMRETAAAPGNKQQEKLWNATLALEKFQMS